MARKPRWYEWVAIMLITLLMWAGGGRWCGAAEPTLVLHWSIAESGGSSGFSTIGWNLEEGGWPGFIQRHIRPALKWCKDAGVKPVILIHHPFGLYPLKGETSMAIDSLDQAKAMEAPDWLLKDFAKAWKPITKEVRCTVYAGGVNDVERLQRLPTATRAAMVARNLKPYVDAGFRGVYIDASEAAIYQPLSKELLTLAIADDLFPERTGVEGPPNALPQYAHLWGRPSVAWDRYWRHKYGGFSPEQVKRFGYGERHSEWKTLGYDRSVLTGEAWRLLPYMSGTKVVECVELARLIVAEGDVAGVCPQPLINAGVKASDLLSGGTK